MKNKIKWLGIIALLAALGFSMAACGGGGGNDSGGSSPFDGTWAGTRGSDSIELKLNNGSYQLKENGFLDEKGTYSTKAHKAVFRQGSMAFQPTHLHGDSYVVNGNKIESKWHSKADFKKLGVSESDLNEIFKLQVLDYEMNGSSLSLEGNGINFEFTKQGGGGGGGGSNSGLPAAKGKLTITNIDKSYNGKSVIVYAMIGNNVVIGMKGAGGTASNPSIILPTISNGKATIPLYSVQNNNKFKAYSGSGTAAMVMAVVINQSSIGLDTLTNPISWMGGALIKPNVKFSGGNASINGSTMHDMFDF